MSAGGAAGRAAWPDNLRLALICGVIVAHAATAYVVDVSWYYEQRTTSALASTVLSFPILLGALFGLGPLFLLAGWLSVPSLARRGPAGFVRGRLVRLGVPLLAFTLVIDPLADWLGKVHSGSGHAVVDYLTDRTGTRDMGPLWFVAALLVFSLVYAGWRSVNPRAVSATPGMLTAGTLAAAGVVVAVGSFAVWLRWRHGTATPLNANWPHWPQAVVMFALGVLAGERRWLEDLDWPRARRLGLVGAVGAVLLAAVAAVSVAGDDYESMTGGWHWQAAVLAVLDGLVSVTWVWWLLAWFQRRWNRQQPWAVRASRGSYAAFLIHPMVLVSLSLALHDLPWPAEAKFAVVALTGIPVTFLAGYGLTRIPGLDRVI